MQDKQHALRLIALLREELTRLFEESKIPATLGRFPFDELRAWKAKAVYRISEEISPFEGKNLQDKAVNLFPPGGLGHIFAREVDLYQDFLEKLATYIETITGSFVPTGWEKLIRTSKVLSTS